MSTFFIIIPSVPFFGIIFINTLAKSTQKEKNVKRRSSYTICFK